MPQTDYLQNKGVDVYTLRLSGLAAFMGWGTGGTIAKADTDLTTPAAEARVSASIARATTTITNDTVRYTATITAAGARAITEVGLFDAAGSGSPPSGGNIITKSLFDVVNVNTGEGINFTIDFKLAN